MTEVTEVTEVTEAATVVMSEVPAFAGPGAIAGIRFRPLAAALGVRAWGMNLMELDPGHRDYPEHDHLGDGQEEVYIVLSGQVELQIAGIGSRRLFAGQCQRVGPEARRKLVAGPEGCTVLAIGGTPGQAYRSTSG